MTVKRFQGKIVSAKMDKNVSVEVGMLSRHPVYKKVLKKSKVFIARNEISAKLGDLVEIVECRPYAKSVTFKVEKVLQGN